MRLFLLMVNKQLVKIVAFQKLIVNESFSYYYTSFLFKT